MAKSINRAVVGPLVADGRELTLFIRAGRVPTIAGTSSTDSRGSSPPFR